MAARSRGVPGLQHPYEAKMSGLPANCADFGAQGVIPTARVLTGFRSIGSFTGLEFAALVGSAVAGAGAPCAPVEVIDEDRFQYGGR